MSISIGAIIGDRSRVVGTFYDLETPAVVADPTIVQFLHLTPDGIETVYTFGVDSEVIKDSVGVYHADLLVQQPRSHYFRVNGLGSIAQSYEDTLAVPESAFLDPLPTP